MRPQRDGTRRRVQAHSAPRLALRLRAPRLDRIVRGRAWIPVLGVLLVAIVGLRVEVLKLGASVGTEVQQATQLQSSNAALRSQISALSDNQRIARLAAAYGMRNPDALEAHFLQARVGQHVGAAIRNISAPSRTNFLTGLAAEVQTDQRSSQASYGLSAVGGQPASGTPLSSATSATSGSGTAGSGSSSTSNTTGASSSGTSSSGGASTSSTSTATGSGSTGSSTGTAATTSSSSSGATSTPASSTSVTGSSTGTSSSGGAVTGTSSGGLPPSAAPTTATANGAAGIGA